MKSYKQDENDARRRVEAWWQGAVVDRPAIQVTAPLRPDEEGAGDAAIVDLDRYWTDPDVVLPRLERRLSATYFGGEAFPVVYPMVTRVVSVTCKYLGAANLYVDRETTWNEPFIERWQGRPRLRFDPANRWWQKTERLFGRAADLARASSLRFYLGYPDLNGPTEILSGLRGSERMALDFYDHPGEVRRALSEVQAAWFECYEACTPLVHALGGYFDWLGIWSEEPAIDLQSDVSCLISSDMFRDFFLRLIEEQTQRIGRTIYHLDGPGAVRHLDMLLALPKLTGIQWVQGAEGGPTASWIPLLKRIQDGGKLLYVYCEKDEVDLLLDELSPEGLMMVTRCQSPAEADALLDRTARAL